MKPQHELTLQGEVAALLQLARKSAKAEKDWSIAELIIEHVREALKDMSEDGEQA